MWTVIKDGKRACIECQQVKVLADFDSYNYTTAQGKRSRRHASSCRACMAVRRSKRYKEQRAHELRLMRAYRAANREALNESLKAYRGRNTGKLRRQRVVSEQKRRLRGYNRCTKSVRAVIDQALALARVGDLYLDAYSGDLIDTPTIDHIVPLSAGGEHVIDNVCVTSFANNRSKRATPLLVWLARRRAA